MSTTPNDSSWPSNGTSATSEQPYVILRVEPVSLLALARSVQGPEWRVLEALLGLERQKHLEALANPRCSDYWGAHRAIANWILEFTTITRENLIGLAQEQRESSQGAREPERPGTAWMEHTTGFDEREFPNATLAEPS